MTGAVVIRRDAPPVALIDADVGELELCRAVDGKIPVALSVTPWLEAFDIPADDIVELRPIPTHHDRCGLAFADAFEALCWLELELGDEIEERALRRPPIEITLKLDRQTVNDAQQLAREWTENDGELTFTLEFILARAITGDGLHAMLERQDERRGRR